MVHVFEQENTQICIGSKQNRSQKSSKTQISVLVRERLLSKGVSESAEKTWFLHVF
jgi:hypothetical protein